MYNLVQCDTIESVSTSRASGLFFIESDMETRSWARLRKCVHGNDLMTEYAYAKVNLGLLVLGRRDNGYHDLDMVMETISIHDELIIERSAAPGIRLTCRLEGGLADKGYELSSGDDNLIVRAGNALLQYASGHGITDPEALTSDGEPGYDITLIKRIPMAAGLAGGSTDAAAALRGISSMLKGTDGTGVTDDILCEIGAGIGADIPYCIMGGSKRASGIGEVLKPLPAPPKSYLIILKPDIDVATGHIYKMTDENTDYASSDRQETYDRFDALISALNDGDIQGVAHNLHNDLRYAAICEHPVIKELEDKMVGYGALGAMMSGSGPSVFAIFDNENARDNALRHISEDHPVIYASGAEFMSDQKNADQTLMP